MAKEATRVLLVEDDPGLQKQMRWGLSDYEVVVAGDKKSAREIIHRDPPAVMILDLGLPPDPDGASEGLALLEEVQVRAPHTKVVVASGNEMRENALRAVDLGAYDFFGKPIDLDVLGTIIRRALEMRALELENERLKKAAPNSPFDGLIAASPSMLKVCRAVERVASADVSVLLLGDSGTGKEVLARTLHRRSNRADRPFIAINCAAIPETLLESELFGHEKGAFTGAVKQTIGKIEQADGGTLFLDEIGDMPTSLQAKVLRFLQEREIERLGGSKPITVDVRVVSATNRDLGAMMRSGEFREDLYYRLNEVAIDIPPLRDRGQDVILIARHILDHVSGNGRGRKVLSQEARAAILDHDWPGNVRELESCVKRAAIMSDGKTVSANDLGLASPEDVDGLPTLRRAREDVERTLVVRALALSNNNVSQAAKLLDVSRPTLYDLMKAHDISN